MISSVSTIKMPTKKLPLFKHRCRNNNAIGELDCNMTATHAHCTPDGKRIPGASAQQMCATHKLPGQVDQSHLLRKLKKLRAGKGASPKKKKLLERKRPSRSQKSRSSSSASTTSSRSCNSNDSYSTSDSNFSSRVAGNCLNFARINSIFAYQVSRF
jgi:hypothetical protein